MFNIRQYKNFFPFLLLILSIVFNGCFLSETVKEENLNRKIFKDISIGISTAQDVCEIFGAPDDVIKLNKGEAYFYRFEHTKSTGLFLLIVNFYRVDTKEDRVVFFFDNKRILQYYGITMNSNKTRYGLPSW